MEAVSLKAGALKCRDGQARAVRAHARVQAAFLKNAVGWHVFRGPMARMVILAAQYHLITVQGQEMPIQASLLALRLWSPRPLHWH
jgi:hypothetical protein